MLLYLCLFHLFLLSVSSSPLEHCNGLFCRPAKTACITSNTISPKQISATTLLNGTLKNHRNSEGKYFPEEECGWSIILPVASSHHLIRLRFTHLETEENCDFVEVYDGPSMNYPLITRISGSVTPVKDFTTTGSMVFIRFTTNDITELSGFTLEWYTVSASAKATVIHQITDQKSGVISNPINAAGTYYAGDYYQWNITLPSGLSGYIIKFQFLEFAVESSGYVKIHDGTTESHRLISSNGGTTDIPLIPVYSTGPYALVRFYVATQNYWRGFTLLWNAVSVTKA